MLIDIHTHVNFKAFEKDGHDVIKRALDDNIGMILVGSQNTTSKRALEYANQYPNDPVFAAVGLHPIHLEETRVDDEELGRQGLGFTTRAEDFDYDYYKTLAQSPKVVAIGEVGLDYYRITDQAFARRASAAEAESRIKQQAIFRKQIELALETKKTLMVHCRKAHDDCIKILKEYFEPSAVSSQLSAPKGDIHFFEGTLGEAQEYFKLGFTVSFTGVITFKNAQHHQALVRNLPLERILLETDAPYITPEPHRGERNEPRFVKLVAQKVAELKGITLEEVEQITTDTAKNVFQLPL